MPLIRVAGIGNYWRKGEADDRRKVRIVDGEREGPTTAFFCELLLRDVMGSCTTVLDSSAL